MNLAAIKAALRTAVSNATEIPVERVQWVAVPESGIWREWPLVDLVFRRPVKVGTDSNRREYDQNADKLTRTLSGPRTFRVEIRVETGSQDGGEEAMSFITRLQTRLGLPGRPAITGALALVGVNVATMAEGIDADLTVDDRTISLSTLEVVFNTVENDVDTTELGDYATRVRFESDKLRNPDESDGPVQPILTVPPLPVVDP